MLTRPGQGPTGIPIAFAFIVGRAIRNYAHWRLQEGDKVGRLDFLYGSTTVTSTLTTMIDLRRFGVLELLLAVVWALSPLGGQAILRVLSFETNQTTSTMRVEYVNMTNSSFPDVFTGHDYGGFAIPVNSLFLSSLGAPASIRNSSMDTWGNLMVPMLEYLPQYTNNSSQEWLRVDNVSNTPTYAGFIGVPTANIPITLNSSFNIETSYWNIQCPDIGFVKRVDMNDTFATMQGPSNASCAPVGCETAFSWGAFAALPSQSGRTGTARCNWTDTARQFQYLSWDQDFNGTAANCSITTSYVDLVVARDGWTCVTEAIRPSTRPHLPQTHTVFDDCTLNPYPWLWQYFSTLFGSLGGLYSTSSEGTSATQGQTRSGSPANLQFYLADPSQALNVSFAEDMPSLWTVDPRAFSIRMTQLFNSYWMATVATEALFLGHPQNYDALSADSVGVSLAQTQATVTGPITVIHCNRGWLAP